MCIAVFKPPKIVIPEDYLRSCWINNPDGAGYCYVKGKKVVVEKGFLTLKEFLAAYTAAAKKNKLSPFLIHFRIRSMGDKGQEHTHPYVFAHGALIHNGTLHGVGAIYGQGPSDTQIFAEKYGDLMTFDNVTKLKSKLETTLDWNKIAILYPDTRHIILNEAKGQWHEGVWYSTNAYKWGNNRSSNQCQV